MKNSLILGSIGAAIAASIILYGSFSFLQVYNQSLLRQTADTYKLDFPECYTDKRPSELLPGWDGTRCTLDSFEPSSSAYHLSKTQSANCDLGDPDEDASGPPKIKRVGSVSFILSSKMFPESEWHHYHCAYYVTVNFSNGEYAQFEFQFNQDPGILRIKASDYPRYEATFTSVQHDRPIAGLVFDRETQEIYYVVTKWIF